MASYDSDDSIEENEEFTETDVLLGYASKESKGETTSRLGGKPVCDETPPSSLQHVINSILGLARRREGPLGRSCKM